MSHGILTGFHLGYVLNVTTKASKLLCLGVLPDPDCPRCAPLLCVVLSLSFAS